MVLSIQFLNKDCIDQDYGENCTTHGIPYILQREQSLAHRVIWIIVVFFGVSTESCVVGQSDKYTIENMLVKRESIVISQQKLEIEWKMENTCDSFSGIPFLSTGTLSSMTQWCS